jgi:hypothetical protein
LCGKVLKFSIASRVNVYSCSTQFEVLTDEGVTSGSHYEIRFDEKTDVQRMVMEPYVVDTDGKSFRSRIYKVYPNEQGEGSKWFLVKEVNRIREDTENNLRERLSCLTAPA